MSEGTHMTTLFIYGSIKKGHYNHTKYGFDTKSKFIQKATLIGAKMYSLGSYPCIVLTGVTSDEVHGELYECTDKECLDGIRRMEEGAGYTETVVSINETDVVTYVYPKARGEEVKDGVWKK